MAEYIERTAAIKVVCEACNKIFPEEPCEPSDCTIMQTLHSIPAADVVERASGIIGVIPTADVREVVLCKDCRHRDPEDHKCDCGQLERAGCVFPVDDNYWCAHGER